MVIRSVNFTFKCWSDLNEVGTEIIRDISWPWYTFIFINEIMWEFRFWFFYNEYALVCPTFVEYAFIGLFILACKIVFKRFEHIDWDIHRIFAAIVRSYFQVLYKFTSLFPK